jgi:hypothetical protein
LLASLLQTGGLASSELPQLLLGSAEYPGPESAPATDIARLMQSDRVRAALGRIASAYDGGHLME